jgi:hypothetical protein
VLPINNQVEGNGLNIDVKQEINVQNPFVYKIPTNAAMVETPTSMMTPRSMITSKNENTVGRDRSRDNHRPRFQFTEAIEEQEEEGKGTIDFPIRARLKGAEVSRQFMSQRDQIRHTRTESEHPLINGMTEDKVEQVRFQNL